MYPPKFGYVIPDSLGEATEFLEQHEDAKALAGGHSLIPMLKLRIIRPNYLVELKGLKELHFLSRDGGKIRIGALTTHYEILKSGIPLLSEAASTVADPQVRNMGTIGGVISHLDPAADYPASLIAMDAVVRIKGRKGVREESFKDFAKDMFTPDLSPGFYATSRVAVSCTGVGELILKILPSKEVDMLRGMDFPLEEAVRAVVGKMTSTFGSGNFGIIALDYQGNSSWGFNTEAMPRGVRWNQGKRVMFWEGS